VVQSQPGEIVRETLSRKNPAQKTVGGVAQDVAQKTVGGVAQDVAQKTVGGVASRCRWSLY
jgi:hypothetical protein